MKPTFPARRRSIFLAIVIFIILITVTEAKNADTSKCKVPAMPPYASLVSITKLPDPFTFMNGTPVKNNLDWPCRRAEIVALAQEFEYGYKPNTPYAATTGSMSANTLTVTVTDSGKTISFNCTITYPSVGSAPYPAMIGIGGSSLNNSQLYSLGVAVIIFPCDDIAQQIDGNSRGKGKFYTMFGSNHSAGALMAWAWGVDRLIDAIEKIPAANIDPKRLGVTGCSRNGKGALACGAFDERIVLTIPQESGSGGSASWRVSDYEFAKGQSTQTLNEITGENVWFSTSFNQFKTTATKLPFDQHSVIGLIAPRACLIIENDILWLGPESSWNCANAAHMVWEGLHVPERMGFTETTGHNHCAFPSSQQPEVNAYVNKFLVGTGIDNTNIMHADPGYTYDELRWVDWFIPLYPYTSVEKQGSIPKDFSLGQNYPNPFNPSTTIAFSIPAKTFVSLKVYNSLGQELAELAGSEYSAGQHTVMFNASNLASGVYYYTMKAGDFSRVEKMILQK